MLYKDPLQSDEFIALARERGACVSLYLPTTPLTQDAQAVRIVLKNLGKQALEQVEAIADTKSVRSMAELLEQLQDDDEFWSRQPPGASQRTTGCRRGLTVPNTDQEHGQRGIPRTRQRA